MTDETKAAIRAVWEAQPDGLGHAIQPKRPDGPPILCAFLVLPRALLLDSGIRGRLLMDANDAFLPEDGVTPEERRDCMVEMLDAGAFDDLGEG